MIVSVDIETSGVSKTKSGIWQIGAIDLNEISRHFFQECRIDEEDEIVNGTFSKPVLKYTMRTEDDFRDPKKQSQKQLLEDFFDWLRKKPTRNLLAQNPLFDVGFLEVKAEKYNLEIPFHYRIFNLHDYAQLRYHNFRGKFLFKKGFSNMNTANILNFCGVRERRGAPNALEDAKLVGECFFRLVYGKNLFREFSQYEIPDYLKT